MKDAESTIEKPFSKKSGAEDNIIIRTMPKEFLGKDISVAVAPVAMPPKIPEAKPLPPPIRSTVTPPKVALPKKKKKGGLVIFIICLLLLIGLSVAGYFWYQSVQTEPEEEEIVIPIEEEEEEEEEVVVILPTRGVDTDSDGLTDVEENLYRTDYRNPDSDGDSYLDGNEVFHRYDPLGFAPSTLLDTGAVREYVSGSEWPIVYSVTHPINWSSIPSTDSTSFVSGDVSDSARFDMKIFKKESADQTLGDWYTSAMASEDGAGDLKVILTKNGYEGLESNDQRKVFLDIGDYVVEFVYELDATKVIYYSQTFQMFVNSFSVQP